jgi:ABC-type dipeptide/oligopeptide/nickel transport system permease component
MRQYVIRRLLQAIPPLILVSILMFTLLHLLPGGPEAVYDNPELDEAGRATLRASFGLGDPRRFNISNGSAMRYEATSASPMPPIKR